VPPLAGSLSLKIRPPKRSIDIISTAHQWNSRTEAAEAQDTRTAQRLLRLARLLVNETHQGNLLAFLLDVLLIQADRNDPAEKVQQVQLIKTPPAKHRPTKNGFISCGNSSLIPAFAAFHK
jgi:hypothetical protein